MPARPVLSPETLRWLPWVVAIAFFMQSLDGTILNTALPDMASDLKENPLRMQGVIVAYMLTVALLIPASGWIADRFGTKKSSLPPFCCSASDRCCARCQAPSTS